MGIIIFSIETTSDLCPPTRLPIFLVLCRPSSKIISLLPEVRYLELFKRRSSDCKPRFLWLYSTVFGYWGEFCCHCTCQAFGGDLPLPLTAFRIFSAISFSACSLGHYQCRFAYLALFSICTFLHIHNLSSVLDLFSATTSLNIGPPSFLLLLLICSVFLAEPHPHRFLQLCLPDHPSSIQSSLIGCLTQPLSV